MPPLFHVVLHQPEIPNNTGNIGRTCVALGCSLHLVRPLGFDITEQALRRAGLDYWPRLDVHDHEDWPAAAAALRLGSPTSSLSPWLFTAKGGIPPWRADLRPGDALVFGKETAGLPQDLLDAYPDRRIMLPMAPAERGLNLATAVCAALYEGLRQCEQRGEVSIGPDGRFRRR